MSKVKDKKPEEQAVITQFLAEAGAKGGRKSKGGGRPRIPDDQMTPEQKKRRARYEGSKLSKEKRENEHQNERTV